MARYVLDAPAFIQLAVDELHVAEGHELLAPTLVRSQTLATLHEAVHRGEIAAAEGRRRLAAVGRIRARHLGDAVLRKVAWQLADELDEPTTYRTEYLALTRLQADALIAVDPDLARLADGVVALASLDDLQRPPAADAAEPAPDASKED